MNDAMVTARMSPEKKREGNLVLDELGLNASQAINQMYDYLLLHESLPFGDAQGASLLPEKWHEAEAWARKFPHVVLEDDFADMTLEDARMRRLSEKGERV